MPFSDLIQNNIYVLFFFVKIKKTPAKLQNPKFCVNLFSNNGRIFYIIVTCFAKLTAQLPIAIPFNLAMIRELRCGAYDEIRRKTI